MVCIMIVILVVVIVVIVIMLKTSVRIMRHFTVESLHCVLSLSVWRPEFFSWVDRQPSWEPCILVWQPSQPGVFLGNCRPDRDGVLVQDSDTALHCPGWHLVELYDHTLVRVNRKCLSNVFRSDSLLLFVVFLMSPPSSAYIGRHVDPSLVTALMGGGIV